MIMKTMLLLAFLGCGMTLLSEELAVGDRVNGDESLLYLEELGKSDPVTVDSGYVFIDTEFLRPPYIIQRIGQAVTINGRIVNCVYREPINEPEPVVEEPMPEKPEDPELPQGVDDSNNIMLEPLSIYLHKKQKYLLATYPKEEADALMIKSIENLPCVKEVKTSEFSRDTLKIAHKKDVRPGFFQLTPGKAPSFRKIDKDSLKMAGEVNLMRLSRYWENKTNVLFFGSCMVKQLSIATYLRMTSDSLMTIVQAVSGIEKVSDRIERTKELHDIKLLKDEEKVLFFEAISSPSFLEYLKEAGK